MTQHDVTANLGIGRTERRESQLKTNLTGRLRRRTDGEELELTTMSTHPIPTVGTRAHRVNGGVADFFANHPGLELGGVGGFTVERRTHMEIFALHKTPANKVCPIGEVEFTAIRGPYGTIPIRVLYPASGEERRKQGQAAALIYFHGGGFSIGSVDEFENGLRLVAEESGCQVIHAASTIPTTHPIVESF